MSSSAEIEAEMRHALAVELPALREENAALRAQVDGLKTLLADARAQVEEQRETIRARTADRDARLKHVEELKLELDSAVRGLERNRGAAEKYYAEAESNLALADQMEDAWNTAQAQVKELKRERDVWKKREFEFGCDVSRLQGQRDEAEELRIEAHGRRVIAEERAERAEQDLAEERSKVYHCPNGCGQLVAVGHDEGWAEMVEAREKAEVQLTAVRIDFGLEKARLAKAVETLERIAKGTWNRGEPASWLTPSEFASAALAAARAETPEKGGSE